MEESPPQHPSDQQLEAPVPPKSSHKGKIIKILIGSISVCIILLLIFILIPRGRESNSARNVDSTMIISPAQNTKSKHSQSPSDPKKESTQSTTATSAPTTTLQPTNTPKPTHTPTTIPTRTPTPTPKDAQPPELIAVVGIDEGGTYSYQSTCMPIRIKDNVSSFSQLESRMRLDQNPWTDWNKEHEECYTNMSQGSHTLYIEIRDEAGNIGSYTRNFSIQVQ